MKQKLQNLQFKKLETEFINWLQTLNYSDKTIKTRKRNIKEFLLYLEINKINTIEKVTNERVKRFVSYLQSRENKLFGSGLMNTSINIGISTVNKFFEYLLTSQQQRSIPNKLKHTQTNYKPKTILNLHEINLLYESSWQTSHFKNTHTKALQYAIAQRDRAMLGIYYGCGLRKSEGTNLKASDILSERKLIHVRKGKGGKNRYVPITENNLNHITEYLQNGRSFLLNQNETVRMLSEAEAFFINQYGMACSDQALTLRLQSLVRNSGNSVLQSKKPSLHTLRHSIATHLLQQGMEIELIQKFMGHGSLESTQVYTHIANEL